MGSISDMGDFKEISNKHNLKDICLGYTFKHKNMKPDYTFETIWKNDKKNSLPEVKSIILKSEHLYLSIIKNNNDYLLNFSYDPLKDPEYDEQKEKEIMSRWIKSFKNSSLRSTNKEKFQKELAKRTKYISTAYKKVSIRNFKIKDIGSLGKEAQRKSNMNLDYTIDGLIGLIWKEYSRVINVISSFRLHPERTYLEQSKNRLKVDKFGDGYLDQIILWERNKSQEFKDLVRILRDELSLLNSLKTNREIGGGRYEVLVKTKENGIETSIFDVGFGINQFLPIIVADLQLPEGSTLFIAEPEIHLHPNVQANFGNYIVKQIDEKKKNYVIETHSEYFLNRIRLAIVNGTLKEENLSVYYLENQGDDTTVHKLNFTKRGSIENAPQSFFDTYLMDIRDIALNAE
ncbi:MAG: DUF3696 domain-containing protein [Chitinophagaceae bacterium]